MSGVLSMAVSQAMMSATVGAAKVCGRFAQVVGLAGLVAITGCASSESNFQVGLRAYDATDYTTAAEKWRASAEAGNPEAQQALGWAYANGLGVERNYAAAREWYSRAAEQGHAGAKVNLAILYFEGLGVPRDDARAAALFEEAASTGYAEAQNSLGRMYKAGRGVPADPQQAAEWLAKAAEQNYAPAQNSLGLMYLNGEGVERDPGRAYVLFEEAVRQGQPGAELNRDFAASFLDEEELNAARASVAERPEAGS